MLWSNGRCSPQILHLCCALQELVVVHPLLLSNVLPKTLNKPAEGFSSGLSLRSAMQIGAMALYDVYLGGSGEDEISEGDRSFPAAAWKLLRSRKAARLACLALALFAYVKLRSWVAGDQLVRIYRKV